MEIRLGQTSHRASTGVSLDASIADAGPPTLDRDVEKLVTDWTEAQPWEGAKVEFRLDTSGKTLSAALDCDMYRGSICHWPPSLFEFQFLDRNGGQVLLLETHTFEKDSDLLRYLEELPAKLDGARRECDSSM